MKGFPALVASLLVVPSALYAQVVPAGQAGAKNFSYFLRYSQVAQFAGTYGDFQTANASGEVEYYSGHYKSPFNLSYVGGYTWTLSGAAEFYTGFFQFLSVNQGLTVHRWKLSIGDNLAYRPQAPVTGLSGIPGTGEPIVVPPTPPNQSILTVGTHALNNVATGEASRMLTAKYEIGFGGNYNLLYYPQNNGLNTNMIGGNGGVTRHIDPRSSISAEYVYSTYTYSGVPVRINSNMGLVSYDRAWTRRLHSHVSAGPDWITSTNSAAVPSETLISASAEVNYRVQPGTSTGYAFVSYYRGTGGGSGFLVGELTQTITAGYSRMFGRALAVEATGGYRHLTGLSNRGETIQGEFGSTQANWLFGRHLSVFVNYTILSQASNTTLPSNVVSGPMQTLGFGITLTPRSRHGF